MERDLLSSLSADVDINLLLLDTLLARSLHSLTLLNHEFRHAVHGVCHADSRLWRKLHVGFLHNALARSEDALSGAPIEASREWLYGGILGPTCRGTLAYKLFILGGCDGGRIEYRLDVENDHKKFFIHIGCGAKPSKLTRTMEHWSIEGHIMSGELRFLCRFLPNDLTHLSAGGSSAGGSNAGGGSSTGGSSAGGSSGANCELIDTLLGAIQRVKSSTVDVVDEPASRYKLMWRVRRNSASGQGDFQLLCPDGERVRSEKRLKIKLRRE